MSIVVSTCKEICNSPLNNSKSKQLYSFSKSKKLEDVKRPICDSLYDLPPVRDKRAPGFGYGNKYDFTKGNGVSPAPNAYQVRKDENDQTLRKKGFSFGLSREVMAATGERVGDKNSPGPGAYDIRGINNSTVSFTFRARTNIATNSSMKNIPGPGQYKTIESITADGKYFLSKFHNSLATVIAPQSLSKSASLIINKDVPGPGHYDLTKTNISRNGSYFVSKFRSSLCRSFGHSMRKSESTNTLSKVPGPGSYRLPSEFGHYESAKAHGNSNNENNNVNKKEKDEATN